MTSEIFQAAKETAFWLGMGGAAYAGYLITLAGIQIGTSLCSKRIETREELDKIIEEEKQKLGLKDNIRGFLLEEPAARCDKYGSEQDLRYEICVGWLGASRITIKHELYHIYKKDKDLKTFFDKFIKYPFVYEFKATAYELFGVKL
jgi:hypothetical protein